LCSGTKCMHFESLSQMSLQFCAKKFSTADFIQGPDTLNKKMQSGKLT